MQHFHVLKITRVVVLCLTFAVLNLAASTTFAMQVDESRGEASEAGAAAEEAAGLEFFERHIRPLLFDHCYECHSGVNTSGGLRLDDRQAMLLGGELGPAIVEFQPDASLLLTAVSYRDSALKMPPEDEGKQLDARQIELLKQWISMGAPAPKSSDDDAGDRLGGMSREQANRWWAFQSWKRDVQVPEVPGDDAWRQSGSSTNAIDNFINKQLFEQAIDPLPAADARTLVRRLYFDLIGLPPTPEVVDVFAEEPSLAAYSRLVDELLDSPQYGVRWGRHWLDLVRYADTAGENTDRPLPHIWRYRNWVIDALNQDLPYDEFVRLQLAGDIVRGAERGERYTEGIIATGYLALARRFGHDIDQDIHLMHEDVIDNLGKTFLGLTVACARCHDHKYDPITAEDYYALYGIFSNSQFSFSGCEAKGAPRDLVPLLSPDDSQMLRQQWQEQRLPFDRQLKQLDEDKERLKNAWQKEVGQQGIKILAGNIPDGGSASLATSSNLDVEAGEILLLVVAPQGNHGADTTQVQWSIEEVDGQGRFWSTDQLLDNISGCQSVDGDSSANGWVFLDWQRELPDLLSEIIEGIDGQASLRGWRSGDTPSVFVNASLEPTSVWTTLPPRSFFVHPGPAGPVAVAWLSPISGLVRCNGIIRDAHPSGPDGIDFSIEHFANVPAAAKLTKAREIATLKRKIATERDAVCGQEPQSPVAFAVIETSADSIQDARLHLRGDPEKLGDEVARGWIEILGGDRIQNNMESGRRELADFIVRHPLTTRVYVNRIWQYHFGRGLVSTPNDFGTRGELPTHPELLEWLSQQFLNSGQSTKALHRLIVHSQAYRRASVGADEIAQKDPENRWLGRFERRRMTAEELRDSLLFVAGTLDLTPGEAHPFPPESTWSFTQHTPFNAIYDNRLRTAYQMVQRQRRHPFLALFDGADPNTSTATRQRTVTPTQALYFMNDPFFHEQTAALAEKLSTAETELSQEAHVARLYRIMFQRQPEAGEAAECIAFLNSYPGTHAERWQALCRVIAASNEFVMVD